MRLYETIIIGAGAGGLMCAAHLPSKSALILEGNDKAGAKIRISGGGKCNITNQKLDLRFYRGDAEFIEYALSFFDQEALLSWFQKRGLEPIVRKGGCYFCPRSAQEALDILLKASRKQTLITRCRVYEVLRQEGVFVVKGTCGDFRAKRVVVASGGLSFARLGATDIGYRIARSFSHRIVNTFPALVGLKLPESFGFLRELSGVSARVCVQVGIKRFCDDLLTAHRGISGPAILNASLYRDLGELQIDWTAGFDLSEMVSQKKHIASLLPLPKRLAKAFLLQLGLQDKPFCKLSAREFEVLARVQRCNIRPTGTFGYAKAEVTAGGVCTEGINPYTMESLRQKGLYFIGEVLDVTGELGGYNFQWAFSSAVVCAESIKGETGENKGE